MFIRTNAEKRSPPIEEWSIVLCQRTADHISSSQLVTSIGMVFGTNRAGLKTRLYECNDFINESGSHFVE